MLTLLVSSSQRPEGGTSGSTCMLEGMHSRSCGIENGEVKTVLDRAMTITGLNIYL